MTEHLFGDRLANLVTGLGTAKDKTESGQFIARWLGRAEIDALYHGDWIASTLIDAPVDDMTREWREWKAGPKQTAALEREERRLGLRHKVNQALKLARKDGGSAILIGTGDAHPDQPLNLASIGKGGVQYLHVLSRYEITPGALDRDPLSPHFGGPSHYTLASARQANVTIHPSRVVRFLGIAPLDLSTCVSGWGSSVLERVYDAVRHASMVNGNLAGLTHEAKVDVYKVKGFTQNVGSPEYRSRIIERFSLANLAKSTVNGLLLDAEEEWDQKMVGFGGFPELIRQYIEIAAGSGGMPVTRLLGSNPGGLNNNNEGSLRHWYDTLSSRQEIELRPTLGPLDDALIRSALGANPDGIWYEFKPLWQLTDQELAEVAWKKAQTAQIHAALGVMPKEAMRKSVRSQISEDGIYPGFDGIMEQHQNEPSEPLITAKAPQPNRIGSPGAANGNNPIERQRVAANDAAPRTLYVSRKVENAAEILRWAKSQGFTTTLASDDLHVTIVYSKQPVDWFAVGTDQEKIVVPRGGPRAIETFGGGAIVLLFSDWSLSWRHDSLCEAGCSWDHPEYQPHVTITYDAGSIDLSRVEPYQGKIVLGPEIFAEVDEDWKPKTT